MVNFGVAFNLDQAINNFKNITEGIDRESQNVINDINHLSLSLGSVFRGIGIILLVYRLGAMLLNFTDERHVSLTVHDVVLLVLSIFLIFMPDIISNLAMELNTIL